MNPRLLVNYEVDGHSLVGDKLVTGRLDAVVVDQLAKTAMLCEFKGGMCFSYRPAQREYLGKPGAIRELFGGSSAGETGYKVVEPRVLLTRGGAQIEAAFLLKFVPVADVLEVSRRE